MEHKRGAKLLRKPSRMRLLLFDHSSDVSLAAEHRFTTTVFLLMSPTDLGCLNCVKEKVFR